MKSSKKMFLLTISGQDRPGIIAEVTKVLFKKDCNLEDISMTLLGGRFSMMARVVVPSENVKNVLSQKLQKSFKDEDLWTHWLETKANKKEKDKPGFDAFLVTAMGADRTGIVYEIASSLSKRDINIVGMNCESVGSKKAPLYALMMEIEVPRKFEIKKLQSAFQRLGKKIQVEIRIKALNSADL